MVRLKADATIDLAHEGPAEAGHYLEAPHLPHFGLEPRLPLDRQLIRLAGKIRAHRQETTTAEATRTDTASVPRSLRSHGRITANFRITMAGTRRSRSIRQESAMVVWDQSVEILRASIFAYAQACHGNLGAGILAVTFLARLALLPIGIRIAIAAAGQQRAMARVQPELEALRRKYKQNPRALADATRRLMAREGVSVFSFVGMLGVVAQIPVFIALYSAVRQASAVGGRFLWIRDLAKPNWPVAIGAAVFTILNTTTGAAPAQNRSLMMTMSAVMTIVALSQMAAGVGLYWGLSSVFGAVQGWAVQRSVRANAV